MAKKKVEVNVRVLIEAEERELDRSIQYVTRSLKQACKYYDGGAVVVVVYDEDNIQLGMDVTGVPSAGLQNQIEELFFEHGEVPKAG